MTRKAQIGVEAESDRHVCMLELSVFPLTNRKMPWRLAGHNQLLACFRKENKMVYLFPAYADIDLQKSFATRLSEQRRNKTFLGWYMGIR